MNELLDTLDRAAQEWADATHETGKALRSEATVWGASVVVEIEKRRAYHEALAVVREAVQVTSRSAPRSGGRSAESAP